MTPMPIQIRIWLMRSDVWRFVGLASTVVGLLCYACSASFNHLVGEWNLLKIFLYGVFSFIICLTMYYPKDWQRQLPTSSLSQAVLSVLALTATSVYSFYYDEAVTGKPDAYSLISYAAFAIMLLSLSRRTHCGVEVDLLYFFLGCLIVQLMRINRLLAIGGAGFSCSLVILRFSLPKNPPQNGRFGPQDQHHVVIHVDSQHQQANTGSAPSMPFESRSKFMDCIEDLKQNDWELLNMLLKRVKHFQHKDQSLQSLEIDHNFVVDALPSRIINDLHEIVKAAGVDEECSKLYSSCRGEFLEQCLSRLGLKKLNNYEGLSIVDEFPDSIVDEFPDSIFDEFPDIIVEEMESLTFKGKVRKWIKASNVAVNILFPSERRLCDRVFGSSSAANPCFMDVCRGSTNELLNFPEVLVIRSRRPEQVFEIHDLHVFETLRDLIREFESLFSDVYNEAILLWNRFLEHIEAIFKEFENQIINEPANEVLPHGGVEVITQQVMDVLRRACRLREILDQDFNRGETFSSLSDQMARIIGVLENKLEEKSQQHLNPALRYFYLMNNGWYIEQEAKDSKLESLLGVPWIQKQETKVRENLEHYQRTSWNEMLGFLKLDKESVAPNVLAKSMKKRLKLFYSHFGEICRVHSTWHAAHEQIRKEIIKSLENVLLPAYGKFIDRYRNVTGKESEDDMKCGIDDVEFLLNGLFCGSGSSSTSS